MSDISNTADVIDVRDIIERIEELRTERDQLKDASDEAAGDDKAHVDWDDWRAGSAHELATLETLMGDLAGNGGDEQWEGVWYPLTLIDESHFETYAEELADELGYMDNSAASSWPFNCIDWEKATRELKMDYSTVDYDGRDYLFRS